MRRCLPGSMYYLEGGLLGGTGSFYQCRSVHRVRAVRQSLPRGLHAQSDEAAVGLRGL